MKRLAVILYFLSFSLFGMGQYYYGGLAYSYPQTQFVVDSSGNVRFQPGDLGFSLQAGAFAGSDLKGSSWFGTSVSPALAYNVSPRFRLKAGVSVMQGFGDSYYGYFENDYSPVHSNTTTTSVFVQGDYILNNKLMLSGAAYKYFTPYNFNTADPRYKGPEGEGFMFNINYRPARNVEINASFEYNNGNRPYSPSPFHRTSPFSSQPYFGW
jgi:hypothetical protein